VRIVLLAVLLALITPAGAQAGVRGSAGQARVANLDVLNRQVARAQRLPAFVARTIQEADVWFASQGVPVACAPRVTIVPFVMSLGDAAGGPEGRYSMEGYGTPDDCRITLAGGWLTGGWLSRLERAARRPYVQALIWHERGHTLGLDHSDEPGVMSIPPQLPG
jgi:hypothetical protein